ncbi:MAG: DNA/RNA nuclease SfsA [Bacteroidales bacterium]|nr:DNA/RNA nuclease SfsA [Bacteroidales bacterium]
MKECEYASFPDAVSSRGKKHLETLVKAKRLGYRTVMIYVIQRSDVKIFAPASNIDPVYSEMLKIAFDKGIEILPVLAEVTPEYIRLKKRIPFEI